MGAKWAFLCAPHISIKKGRLRVIQGGTGWYRVIGTWDQHAGFVFLDLVGAFIEQAPEAVARTSDRLVLSVLFDYMQ